MKENIVSKTTELLEIRGVKSKCTEIGDVAAFLCRKSINDAVGLHFCIVYSFTDARVMFQAPVDDISMRIDGDITEETIRDIITKIDLVFEDIRGGVE